jgi:hypothetical protein
MRAFKRLLGQEVCSLFNRFKALEKEVSGNDGPACTSVLLPTQDSAFLSSGGCNKTFT